MDPLSVLLTALISGAAAGLRPTVTQAVKDAYGAVKAHLQERYSDVSVDQLEKDPSSAARQGVLKEELGDADAASDKDLLALTRRLLNQIAKMPTDALDAAGVDLHKVRAAAITIEDVSTIGSDAAAVRLHEVEASGDIIIRGIHKGGSGPKGERRS